MHFEVSGLSIGLLILISRDLVLGQAFIDILSDLLRGDVLCLVIGQLFFPASLGLVYGELHAVGDLVRVHQSLAIHIPCGPSHGLRQGAMTA